MSIKMESNIIRANRIYFNSHSVGIFHDNDYNRYNIAEHDEIIKIIIKHKKHIEIHFTDVELCKYAALFSIDNNLLITNCDFTNFSSSLEYVVYICIFHIDDIQICLNNAESLVNLHRLYISWHLPTFPEQITKITSLKHLSLMMGSLSTLPDSFVNLVNLQHLELSYNNFTEIPEVLGCLNIQCLYINNNPISIIPDFVCNMNTVFVHGTNIKILPKNIQSNVVCDNTPLFKKCIKHWKPCDNPEVVKFSNALHAVNYTITYLAMVHNVPLNAVSLVAKSMLVSS